MRQIAEQDKEVKVLIIDNYDSFTYNLFHYVQQVCEDVEVMRNDEISLDEIEPFTHIIISPGPGLPEEAGITMQVLSEYHSTKKILGVCLGCQAIALFYGGKLYNQQLVAHGISRRVEQLKPGKLLKNLPSSFMVGLYHSWAIDENSIPQDLTVTSKSEMNTIMSLEHEVHNVAGVQFHPESIMTEGGLQIIKNWLEI